MKLYFYVLETEYRNNESKIVFSECDVEEKPKTYKPVDRFPQGIYASYIRKDEIGHISGYSNNRVVLTEPDVEKVKQLFSDQIERKIKSAQETIDALEEKLSAVRLFVG